MLHFQEAGRGTPLVLLHAFPLSSELWRPQLEALQDEFRVVAPDLPGFGSSPDFESLPGIEQAATSVMALLQSLKIERCVLGGLSMGGYTALSFARLFPEALCGLILADTRAEADTEEAKANRNKMIALVESEGGAPVVEQMLSKLLGETTQKQNPTVVEAVRQIGLSQSPSAIANALRALRDRNDSLDLLPQISVPALVIVGDEDVLTPPAAARTLAGNIPDAQLCIIPQAGHLSNREQPEPFNAAVRDFIRAV